MGKSATKPVIWLLLLKKVPKPDIIKLGFKAGTVYSYSSRFPFVKEDYKKALKELKVMKKK